MEVFPCRVYKSEYLLGNSYRRAFIMKYRRFLKNPEFYEDFFVGYDDVNKCIEYFDFALVSNTNRENIIFIRITYNEENKSWEPSINKHGYYTYVVCTAPAEKWQQCDTCRFYPPLTISAIRELEETDSKMIEIPQECEDEEAYVPDSDSE